MRHETPWARLMRHYRYQRRLGATASEALRVARYRIRCATTLRQSRPDVATDYESTD